MPIILLRGFSHSGKDYIGQILCDKYNYKRFAFADSLKIIISNEFGCPLEQLHSQEGKLQVCETDSQRRTYRQILIDEALRLRNINPDIFVNHCCQEIIMSCSDLLNCNIVITDWRYPNEIDVLLRVFQGNKIIPVHILREGQEESPVSDISEHHLDERKNDYKLINKLDNSIYIEIQKLINYINLNGNYNES